MFIVLHAGDGVKVVAAQGLVSNGVEEEEFTARTKNNDPKFQIVIQAGDINTYKSFDSQGHKVLD